jgi:phosphoenolpyruvate---glycerone phosphotransferase subunit DhaL
MTGQRVVTSRALRAGLLHAGEQVRLARSELCALDAAAGDGDLGVTLATGFEHVRVVLEALEDADAGVMLTKSGAELARTAPSTMGTLLATAFLRAGRSVTGVTELHARHVAELLLAAASGVAERGRARAGQRTVLDAMYPAAAAAAAASAAGEGPARALAAAAAAAAEGAEQTTSMEPQHGRSAWLRERARGTKDAGAAAWAIFLAGLAASCQQEPAGEPAGPAEAELAAGTAADGERAAAPPVGAD